MKMKLLVATFVIIVVTGTGYGVGFQKRVHVQREFNLRLGSVAIVKEAGLTVTFAEMVEDSRCPEGVNCIWAGNGKIKITLKKGSHKSMSFELNTMTEPKSFAYQGYEVTLVKLDPYPKHDMPTRKRDYAATLKVTKEKLKLDVQEPRQKG